MGTTKACGSHCNSGPLCCLMHLRYTTLLLVCLPFCPLQFTTSLCPLRSDLRDGTFSLKRVDPSFNTWVFSSDPLCKSFGVKSLPFEAKKTYSYLNPLVFLLFCVLFQSWKYRSPIIGENNYTMPFFFFLTIF